MVVSSGDVRAWMAHEEDEVELAQGVRGGPPADASQSARSSSDSDLSSQFILKAKPTIQSKHSEIRLVE